MEAERQELQRQARVREEKQRKDIAEETIKAMEAEEEKMIERLRATQDKQRLAYEGLEKALQS